MLNMHKILNEYSIDIPKFGEPIQNQTIAVGRDAVFSCVVDNLQTYKVSFTHSFDEIFQFDYHWNFVRMII